MIGRKLGPYAVVEKLGEGGMGVVYRAMDERLDRFVALKVLPSERSDRLDSQRRFALEAKTTSALNHPNIVTIYDIGAADEVRYIAMEYVKGLTLRDVIGRTGLSIERTLDIGAQIADALLAAHRAGVLHRDLKPGNIMLTEEQRVKVLDFGLAKLMEPTSAAAETDATRMLPDVERSGTQMGVVVGTISYMSPEQLEGRPLGATSDVFSFGCVLYAMVTGTSAFGTDRTVSTIAAVLTREPRPVRLARPDVPEELARIIALCLAKNPTDRPDLGDVKRALDNLRTSGRTGSTTIPFPGQPRVLTSRRRMLTAATTIAACLVVIALGWRWWSSRAPQPAPLNMLKRLTSDAGLSAFPAISPDGTLVAFASDRAGEGALNIWVRQTAGGEAIRLTRGSVDDQSPAFSPDGSQIVFNSDRNGGGIFLMSALGGEPRQLVATGRRPRFSPDGRRIAFFTGPRSNSGSFEKIFLVPSGGGVPVAWHPEFNSAMNPVWSPDGRYLLFMGKRDATDRWPDDADWRFAPIDDGTPQRVGAFALLGRDAFRDFVAPDAWVAPNDIIFSRRVGDSTNVWRVSLSSQRQMTRDPPQRLTFGAGLEFQPAVTPDGGVIFASQTERLNVWGLTIDAKRGVVTGDLQSLTQSEAIEGSPSITTEGDRFAFVSNRDGSDRVWMHDVQSGREAPLTGERSVNGSVTMARDGSRVAWEMDDQGRRGFYMMATTNGVPEKICDDCGNPLGWTIDGTQLLYQGSDTPSRFSLLNVLTKQSTPLVAHPDRGVFAGNISADGAWITFHAIKPPAGQQIYVAPLRGASIAPEAWIAITDGESEDDKPRWSVDGTTIYFTSMRDGYRCLWMQRVDGGTKRPVGEVANVRHFHSARLGMLYPKMLRFGVSVARDKIIFTLVGRTANLWMASPEAPH